jgi:hypothetical protein
MSLGGANVRHHTTGHIGGINYDVDGYPLHGMLPISESVKHTMTTLGADGEFLGPFITRYIHVPYDKLKIKNKDNGDILWPFSRDSFDHNEWNAILCGIKDYNGMVDEANKTRNAPASLRKRLPTGFYGSVIKRMGVNLLCNPHGQLEPVALIEGVLKLDTIYGLYPEPYYIYKDGISDACNKILAANNVGLVIEDISTTRNRIRKRDKLFYITERHDYFLDYVAGGIDYITYMPTKVSDAMDADYYIKYTPYEKHSIEYMYNHVLYKSESVPAHANDSKIQCVQVPTIKTMRALDEYKEIAKITPSVRVI